MSESIFFIIKFLFIKAFLKGRIVNFFFYKIKENSFGNLIIDFYLKKEKEDRALIQLP